MEMIWNDFFKQFYRNGIPIIVAIGLFLFLQGCVHIVKPYLPAYVIQPSYWTEPPTARGLIQLQAGWERLQKGDLEEARTIALDLQVQYPDWSSPLTLEGWTYFAEKRYAKAIPLFQKALQKNTGDVGALIGLVASYERQEDWVAALQYADLARKTNPNVLQQYYEVLDMKATEAMITHARRFRDRGNVRQADYMYRRILSKHPELSRVAFEYGQWLESRGELAEAVAYYQLALSHHPQERTLLKTFALALFRLGRYDQALEYFRTLVQLEPDNPEWRSYLEKAEYEVRKTKYSREYRSIERTERITRGQLAGLLCLEIPEILELPSPYLVVILQDIQGYWASSYIQKLVQLGIMKPVGQNRFEPSRTVLRGEFAEILYRVMHAFGADAFIRPRKRIRIMDISPVHRQYYAIQLSVELGMLPLRSGNRFQAQQPVTGKEALQAVRILRNFLVRFKKDGQ